MRSLIGTTCAIVITNAINFFKQKNKCYLGTNYSLLKRKPFILKLANFIYNNNALFDE